MQNKVYSRYIYQMLMEHSCVAVPEMGTFILQFDQAYFGLNHEILHPPKSKVYFSPSIDKDYILSALLVDDGMQSEDASLVENLLVKDFTDSVKKQIPFEFNEFGTLVNNLFVPKNEDYFNQYIGLSAIPAKIIQKGNIKHDESFQYYLKKHIPGENKSDSSSLLLPIIIALITILCIIFWAFSNNNDSNDHNINKQTKPSDALIISTDSIYNNIDSSLSKQNPNDFELPDETSNTGAISTKSSSSKKNTKTEAPIINQSESIDFAPNNDVKKCVIIIGAFSDLKNANHLAERVGAKGFEVFRQQVNGLSRVGIRYNCEKIEPEIFKSKIRKIFNEDAWHLHDTIGF